MNAILDMILSGIFWLILIDFYFFIPLTIFFICEILIKGVILVKLNNKYEERFTNKQIILFYLKDILKYKIFFQAFINLISACYSIVLNYSKININYGFLIIFFDILVLIFSYKIIYKKCKKNFNTNKMCIWYSFFAMPDILMSLIYNGVIATEKINFLYII